MERFKTKLTMEQVLEDYQYVQKQDAQGCGTLIFILLSMCFVFVCVADFPSSKIVAGVILAMMILWILGALISSRRPKKELGPNDFQIVEDYVVKLERNRRGDNNFAYAYFQKSGMIEINDYGSGKNHCKPTLGEVRVGDCFYVASRKPGLGHLLYERKEWRLHDLTEEQLAAELREEDELIARIMECERFPKLTMHRDHYAQDGHLYQMDMTEQKTDAEYNLMERLAIRHFFGDRLNAMEYLIRYCPAEIQRKAIKEMTKLQKILATHILRHMKEDEKKADRQEKIEKIKSLFGRSDEL